MSIVCVGYQCVCGEKVAVTRFFSGGHEVNEYPARITVACSHGHSATFTADHYAALEHWDEPASD